MSIELNGVPIKVLLRKRIEEDLTQPYDKSPYSNRKFIKSKDNAKRLQNFDCITIAYSQFE